MSSSVDLDKATAAGSPPPPPLSTAPPLLVKKLSTSGRTPTKGSAFAAGYDLYAARNSIVPNRGKCLVDTDIAIAVTQGCCKD